jgi:hypothetical protein
MQSAFKNAMRPSKRQLPSSAPKERKPHAHSSRDCRFVQWVMHDERAMYMAMHAVLIKYQPVIAAGDVVSWASIIDDAEPIIREGVAQTIRFQIAAMCDGAPVIPYEDAVEFAMSSLLDYWGRQGAIATATMLQKLAKRDTRDVTWDAIDRRGDVTYAAANLSGGIIQSIIKTIMKWFGQLIGSGKGSTGGGGGSGGGADSDTGPAFASRVVLKGFFETEGDNRVCSRCGPYHGKQYSAEELSQARADIPPLHSNCRCRIRIEQQEMRNVNVLNAMQKAMSAHDKYDTAQDKAQKMKRVADFVAPRRMASIRKSVAGAKASARGALRTAGSAAKAYTRRRG